MLNETWKPIKGYERLYEISDCGHVRSIASGKLRKCKPSPWGYLRMPLSKDGRSKTFQIHTLVAEAFIGERPQPAMEVNHKDGNKKNNSVGNLEWVTKSENKLHSIRLGLANPTANLPKETKGESNGRAKITEADVRTIRELKASGIHVNDIAERYGLKNRDYVYSITNRKTWKHVA